MDKMFSFLSDCMLVGNQRYILRNMSLLKSRLPRLLPSVECIPTFLECMAIDTDSSTNSFCISNIL